MIFGLIGANVTKSYSRVIHDLLSSHPYELVSLKEEELGAFFKNKDFVGINVTMPYKEKVMKYLSEIDPNAKAIGCVNTIVNTKDRGLIGYNTDYDGFLYCVRKEKVHIKGKVIVILGTGATSKTVTKACKDLGAKEIIYCSAHYKEHEGTISVDDLYNLKKVDVLINTTPCGMAPNVDDTMVQLSHMKSLKKLKAVIDWVYDPINTKLLATAKLHRIKTICGLQLLAAQAFYSSQYFVQRKYNEVLIDEIYATLAKRLYNLVLIGMPYSGKSTLGKLVAQNLGKEFIDLDELIEKQEGKSCRDIIKDSGEEAFREIESKLCKEYAYSNNKVLSCGGGIVTRQDNMVALRQNGIICNVVRDEEDIEFSDVRPLASTREAYEELYERRKDLYRLYQTFEFDNNDSIEAAAEAMEEQFYENIGN